MYQLAEKPNPGGAVKVYPSLPMNERREQTRRTKIRITSGLSTSKLHLRNLVVTKDNRSTMKLGRGDHDLNAVALSNNSCQYFDGQEWIEVYGASSSPSEAIEFFSENERWNVRYVSIAGLNEPKPAPRIATMRIPRAAPATTPPARVVKPQPQFTWASVWAAVGRYTRGQDIPVCELRSRSFEYDALISGLRSDEKHALFGVPVCFPSQQTWNTRPDVAAEAIAVLSRMGVL